jgi:phage-related protein
VKAIRWLGNSFDRLKNFPKEAMREAGYQLNRVQHGEDPFDFKPMSHIGLGAFEIRIYQSNEYRVVYVAKFQEAVYVLHAFGKKTRKTSSKDLKIAKQRYAKLKKL